MTTNGISEQVLASAEPSIGYKIVVNVLDKDRESAEIRVLQDEIRESSRVRQLLSECDADGSIPFHPYAKWYGAHWVLADLAHIGYPTGDQSLLPLRERVYKWLFGTRHQKRIRSATVRLARGQRALRFTHLDLADDRTDELAARLVAWRWPDGGWNCDRRPDAENSSFVETLIPLRGLALHARLTGKRASQEAAERAADVLFKRRLYKRRSDGSNVSAVARLLIGVVQVSSA